MTGHPIFLYGAASANLTESLSTATLWLWDRKADGGGLR
jgi:hypothetical protein